MKKWAAVGLGSLVAAGGAAVIGRRAYRIAMGEAEEAYGRIVSQPDASPHRFDAAMVAGLPEIAQRYFRHSIAPATPLYSSVELEMTGEFTLGRKDQRRPFAMTARQVLRAPDQFAWLARMRSGAVTISGSDGLTDAGAWTRFWLSGLVPVANERSSPDLVRSAQFRAAVESALWIPPTLLPGSGTEWEQIAANKARVTLRRISPPIELVLEIDETGRLKEVVGQRWSNANADKSFRLQPFGGTMISEARFQGLTIPGQVAVGNHYGTADYYPFFQATLTRAHYR